MSSPLRSLLLSFGISIEGKEKLDAVDSTVENILSKVSKLGVGLASVFLVKEVTGFIADTIEMGRSLGLTAEKLGVNVDELERFRYAASMAGVDTSFADRALMMFNRQLGEAEIGSKAAGKGLGQLGTGMSAAQLSAMPLQDLLGQVADKFAGMTDKGKKTQLAMKLFGRQGTALIPMLDQGAAGMKKWNDEFDALGGGIGADFAQKAKEAGNEIKKLDFTWKVLKTRLVGDILPAFNGVVTWLTKTVVQLEWLQKHSYWAQTALIALCTAAVIAFAPFLASIAPIVAAATALYLVFDDIYTMMRGGNSLLGHFIDALFGEGAHKTFVKEVKEDFKILIDWMKDVGIPAVKEFWHWMSEEGSGPAIKGMRMLGDAVHGVWVLLKGAAEAAGYLASGDWKKAGETISKANDEKDRIVRGGGKTDEEMNADAKREAAEREKPWTGLVDKPASVPYRGPGARDMGDTPGPPAGWNGVTQKFDIDVHVNLPAGSFGGVDLSGVHEAAKKGVEEAITKGDVKRAVLAHPWAPGMPIPAPGGP